MRRKVKFASIVNVVINIVLFFVKIIIGLLFGVVSLISDAINSFTDIVAAIFIFYSVKINDALPDSNHEFGHSRAENIAGYTTGLLMMVLGVSVIKYAVERIIKNELAIYSNYILYVIGITFFVKFVMYVYIKSILNKESSPALKANLQDHLNDLIVIVGVLFAVVMIRLGYPFIDPIVGIMIGLYIIWSGFEICRENVNYLMGVCAERKIVKKIKRQALKNKYLKNINEVKTQYLGNKVQVEIHVALCNTLTLSRAHDIANDIKKNIESLKEVNNCFVHVDPCFNK